MRQPEELKIKETVEKKDTNFEEFIEIFKKAKKVNNKATKIINEYVYKANKIQKKVDESIRLVKEGAFDFFSLLFSIYTTKVNSILNKEVTESFTLSAIKNLDGVKDCFMEEDKLVVILNERKLKEYRFLDDEDEEGEIPIDYTMPSYKVTYFFEDYSIDKFNEEVPEKFRLNLTQPKLNYTVQLAEPDKFPYLMQDLNLAVDNTENVGSRFYIFQSPYQRNISEFHFNKENYNGCGTVCFGDSNSYQENNLEEANIIPHLIGVIQTLYTDDTEGRGYSGWRDIIIAEKTFQLTKKFKKEIFSSDVLWFFLCYDGIISNKIYFNINNFDEGVKVIVKDVEEPYMVKYFSSDRTSLIESRDNILNTVYIIHRNGEDSRIDASQIEKIIYKDKEYEIEEFIKKLKKIYESSFTFFN